MLNDNFINRRICDDTVALLNRDPAFIHVVLNSITASGLAEKVGLRIDEANLDPYRPCPTDWKALQVAFFDNGEIESSRKRPKIQRTKMRWGANIMVWTREAIKFSDMKQVAWQANIYLWTADEAREIVRDLRNEKYIDDATVALVDEATEGADDRLRFSVPLFKASTATRWMKEHIVVTIMGDQAPGGILIQFPDQQIVTSEPMDTHLPDGQPLSGKAKLQARLARDPALHQWATEVM